MFNVVDFYPDWTWKALFGLTLNNIGPHYVAQLGAAYKTCSI